MPDDFSSRAEAIRLIDGRCGCEACRARTEDTYRMVSFPCRNCGGGPFLILYRVGDPTRTHDCPLCKNFYTVHAHRLATADEIPVAFNG